MRWHLQFAWWSLVCFVVLGITLESLHAFKAVWYLGEDYQMRRLMWTLAHAHGVLLSLVHVAFAATLFILYQQIDTSIRRVSRCLVLASLLLPGGFFLGGSRFTTLIRASECGWCRWVLSFCWQVCWLRRWERPTVKTNDAKDRVALGTTF